MTTVTSRLDTLRPSIARSSIVSGLSGWAEERSFIWRIPYTGRCCGLALRCAGAAASAPARRGRGADGCAAMLAIGDVAGHGLEAASGMAHIRYELVAWLSIGIVDP